MPEKKKSEQPKKNKRGSRVGKPTVNLQLRDVSNITGSVNVAGRDIVNHITNIQGALTPGEVLEKDLQIEIDKLAQGVRGYLERLKGQALHNDVPIPYKGLEAYTLSDAEAFFGRDQAIRELREALKRSPLTILQAESGAGKTSLLQAGLIPRLMAEEHLVVWLRSQFDNPSVTIKQKFIGNLELTPKLANSSLVDFLRRITAMIGVQTTLYVILDQFEEFFSKHTPEEDRQAFIRDLAGCLNDSTLNVRWVISITTDAFGQLGKFEPHIQNPFLNAQSLYLLNREEAAEVIAKPAQLHALTFQDGLLEQLLDDLGQQQNAPIAPTQIQLVCLALYDELRERDTTFTLAQYEQKGGAAGILHGYVGNVLQHDLPLDERAPAYKIFEELVTSEKKRIIRGKSDLETALQNKGISHALAESTLNHLVNRRLLRQLGDNAEQIQFEIVHDYLLKEIDLNDDVRNAKEAEELLQDGLKAWRRNRNFLLTREHLTFIESQFDRGTLALNEEATEFLLLSAAVNNRSITHWLGAISKEKIAAITSQAVRELTSSDPETRRKSKAVAWAMRAYLPANTYRKLYFGILFSKAWILVPIVLIIGLAFQPVRIWLLSPEFSGWEPLSRFEEQTHANLQSMSLGINLDNPDEVYVSDQTPGVLFTSTDGGRHWKKTITNGMKDAILQLSSVIENNLYALTENAAWVSSDRGQNWEVTANINLSEAEKLISISVNPRNAEEVYIGGDSGKLYHTVNHGKSWDKLPNGGYDGKRIKAIATNGNVLIVATEEGLWVNTIENNEWNEVSLAGCEGVQDPSDQVSTLVIPYPRDDPPDNAVGFWAAISGVGICDSDTENLHETTLYYPDANSLSSIAATGDVTLESNAYLSAENGIVRYRTWFYNDPEWWRIKIQSLLPK